jgi:hypothetical protein
LEVSGATGTMSGWPFVMAMSMRCREVMVVGSRA